MSVDKDNPNTDVIKGLRDIADLLEAHPEVPEFRAVVWSSEWRMSKEAKAAARDELTAVARALGDRAEESTQRETVQVGTKFGPVAFHASAYLKDLGAEIPKPQPRYVPILGEREAAA